MSKSGSVFTLTRIADVAGNTLTFDWKDGQLVQVTEPAGRWLKIKYATVAGGAASFTVIDSVTASDGRSVRYEYVIPGGAQDPVLATVRYPDGTAASYTYAQPRPSDRMLLVTADDPHGDAKTSIRGLRIRYHTEPEAAQGQVDAVVVAATDGIFESVAPEASDVRAYGITHSSGAITHDQFTAGGNLLRQVDGRGFAREFSYDANGRGFKVGATDALGNATKFANDAGGHVVKITFPDNSARAIERDNRGRILAETDELGLKTTVTRDSRGRVVHVVRPDGATVDLEYNGFGQVVTEKATAAGTTKFDYDSRGRLTKVTDPLGNSTSTDYDAFDRVKRTTDALGHATQYQRDAAGHLTRTTFADGSSADRAYDAFGHLIKTTDAHGAVRTMVYDDYGRLKSTFDALGHETVKTYADVGSGTPFGKPTKTVSPSGRVTATVYDADGRPTAQTVAAGTKYAATVRFVYDGVGRRISATDGRGSTTQYVYNRRGQRTKVVNALGYATTTTYDAAGRKIKEVDAKGNATTWTYDSGGRELSRTDAAGHTSTRKYDAGGRLGTLTDARGSTYRFEHDAAGRLTALSYPDGSRETNVYDAAGNKVRYTNRAGVSQSFQYDLRNREVASEWADGTQKITKTYDGAGRMLAEDNGVSRISYEFDDIGRVVAETEDLSPVVTGGAFDPAPQTVRYSYAVDGRRASMAYPDGALVKYDYNARGQLENIYGGNAAVPLATYVYDAAGNATEMPRDNRTITSVTYDETNRITGISDLDASQNPLTEIDYNYDEIGNRVSTDLSVVASGGGGSQSVNTQDNYAYDAISQVTAAKYGAPAAPAGKAVGPAEAQARFDYDAVGNRVQVTEDGRTDHYAVDAANQYTQAGKLAITSDQNGNVATVGGSSFQYDAMNRMVAANTGTTSARFFYDAKNRCVARNIDGVVTLNTFDNWNVLEERDDRGAERGRYVHGLRVDEIVVMVNRFGTFYPHRDVLGNVTMVTDKSGQVVERYGYSVFGAVSFKAPDGSARGHSAIGNRWLFNGRELISELGVYDYRNRTYSPTLGRFLQSDRARFNAGDVNLYRYVGNNPLVGTDPYGLWVTWAHNSLVESAYGGFLSDNDINLIEQGSYTADTFSGSQEPDYSFVHAMSAPGQDPAVAESLSATWVDTCLQNAIDAEVSGDHAAAMEWFGAGSHTLMDSTSPSHENFQTWEGVQWYNPISWIEGLVHVVQEIWPSDERRHDSDELLNDYYDEFQTGVADYYE
jgi:RHS repeat-associated protein